MSTKIYHIGFDLDGTKTKISEHHQSWGYEEDPSKGLWSLALLVIADYARL